MRLRTGLEQTALVVGVFLVAFGARLVLLKSFASDVPFWDQWDAEGHTLYLPVMEHGVWSVPWFAAHNEHRILWTRLTAYATFVINQQWDPLVQVTLNAAIHSLFGGLFALLVARSTSLSPALDRTALLLVTLLGLTMPFAWENTLAGFQNQFSYMLFFSVLLVCLAARAERTTPGRTAMLVVVGGAAFVSVAAGALASLVGAMLLAHRALCADGPQKRRGLLVASAALAVVFVLGIVFTPTIQRHTPLHATGVTQWLTAFAVALSWPFPRGYAPLVWAPWAVLACAILWRPRRTTASEYLVVGLGGFTLAALAAMCWSRGAVAPAHIASRYTDFVWLLWLVNLWAIVVGVERVRQRVMLSRAIKLAAIAVFATVAATGLVQAGIHGLAGASERKLVYDIETRNVLSYVQTGDFGHLRDKPFLHIPYPRASALRELLDDQRLRAILPPGIRPALLKGGLLIDTSTFSSPGTPPGVPVLPPRAVFGSYGPQGDSDTGDFRSRPIRSGAAMIRTRVAGYVGQPGLDLYVEEEGTGKRQPLVPSPAPGDHWTGVLITPPRGDFRLVARDRANGPQGWLAFSDPIEVGRLRPAVEHVLEQGPLFAVLGLAVIAIPLARRRDRRRDCIGRS